MVYQVVNRAKIPVIGIGGILSAKDVLEYLITGARAVEVGTANLIDPEAPVKIIKELTEYCQKNGMDKIESIIGTLKKPQGLD